ncbi:hypothetical protein HF324_23440 [Chitinophaga oryzae]|uniref:Uncharacterized protein n=1 Tax=Chitinophaga oryzae TaxID=2725414 RepID=A0AAE6ZLF4_9BACT|nr:hypothetical protein [Chitinophaga oryzae]QJB34108.1 hypothetical protein HF329_23590 [Chitinophaga oryzae]QJB40627.1 hypothetical protein HF324_23440 [Chitinophaga oryzae]
MNTISSALRTAVLSGCCVILSILTGCKKEGLKGEVGDVFKYTEFQIMPGVTLGSVYYTNKFNAFTDLAYFKGRWMVVFREGTQHEGGMPGRIKVLTSADAQNWKVEQTFALDSVDLRDPKLVIDSVNNTLSVTFFGIDLRPRSAIRIRNYYVEYSNPSTDIAEIVEEWPNKENYYLWRWTSESNENYCVGYRISRYEDTTTNLILLAGNHRFGNRKIINHLNLRGQPTETTLRFGENKRMVMVVRSDEGAFHIGTAEKPYTNFVWLPNNEFTRLASPNFLFYKSYLLITGRDLRDNKFRFFAYNQVSGKIEKEIEFPGGYEVGYGGMSFNPANKSEMWVSYYSIEHGGRKSNIYLAKINLPEVLK